jgi:alpha-D-ribose 1-methylphosphonate 5-triphosphate synthase subunit PhnI
MGYVAVSGGTEAIEASIELLKYYRTGGEQDLKIAALRDSLRLLIDRVMGEAGLYAPDFAAIALKQCEGSVDEAVFLLRAYRSTLSRNYYANPIDGQAMRLVRRISSAFKDIPGGQMLGPTYDYTHRLIDFGIAEEDAAQHAEWRQKLEESKGEAKPLAGCMRVAELLRADGLMAETEPDNEKPFDVTQHMLEFPAPRSARLQTLARADTGYISGLAYASLRGYSSVHPTVGELRCGWAEVTVPYLFGEGQSLWIGEILMTEVESFVPSHQETGGTFDRLNISIGYGAAFGRNENKAIAMSILDSALDSEGNAPTQDEEFVLMHGDSLEMNGFISHLKLPHYVTFQSKLDRVRGNNKNLTPQPPPPDWGRGQE